MSARSRRKGHQWERDVARMFSKLLGFEVRRGISQTRGATEPDVDCPGWWVECKVSVRPPSVWAAMRQAVGDSDGTGRTPVVFARHNGAGGKPPTDLVVMRREDWMTMVARAHGSRDPSA